MSEQATAQVSPNGEKKVSCEITGTVFTLPMLRLLDSDMDTVFPDLATKVGEAPQFFDSAPIVIDVEALQGKLSSVDLALLVGFLRSHHLVPVGIRGGDAELNEIASAMELAVLSQGAPIRQASTPRVVREPESSSRLVVQPVRSGQRVYASNSDLIVLGPVSPGAEVFADGNVHVYGVLRGRALAGVKGDQHARIFCQSLEAELVSVAGTYRVSEDINANFHGTAAQVYLDSDQLVIGSLSKTAITES